MHVNAIKYAINRVARRLWNAGHYALLTLVVAAAAAVAVAALE